MTDPPKLNEINIGDVLRLSLPLDTTIIAEASQARRNVHWVVLLTTWDDLEEQVQAGDLAILPPALQSSVTDVALKENLIRLSNLTVTGLLLFQEVSDEVEREAAALSIPLLVIPPGNSIRDIHRAIAALLVDQQSATTERGMQLYRKLSEMSREGQGLAAMTEVMAKLTGKMIIVQDKRLEIQAVSIPHNSPLEMTQLREVLARRDELPTILRNRKAAARTRQSHWQQFLPIENMGRLVSPIISGDRARGYLSVIGPADQLDLLDSLTVEQGAAACALEMAKAKAVSEAKKALRGDFLEGLLAGTLPPKEVERLESRLDHNTKQPHAILILAWQAPASPSLRRLETAVNWVLSNHSRPALAHVYSDKHVCIFQALKDSGDIDTARELGRRLYGQVKAEFPDVRLIAGMSGPAPTLADWPAVYNEALKAMQLGARLKLNYVVEFNSLGVYQLLGQLEDIPTVRAFARQVVGPLAQYDEQHRSNLVQTIDAYFAHHGNVSQTAESLFIHRNTLLYRLDRIQELTGHDLDQSNMRLALHLALKLWQLRPDT